MAEAFDAYYVWLGIPPKDQPPHYYRLLGLELYESETSVIENAADRQMGHVRLHQSGKHAQASQRILNEVAAARVCLLNADRKAKYDTELRQRLRPVAAPPMNVPVGVPVASPCQASTVASPVPPPVVTPPPLKPPSNQGATVPAAAPPPPKPRKNDRAKDDVKNDDEQPRLLPWKLAATLGGLALGAFAVAGTLLIAVLVWFVGSDSTPIEADDNSSTVASADSTNDEEPHDPENDTGTDHLPVENDEDSSVPSPESAEPAPDPLSELPEFPTLPVVARSKTEPPMPEPPPAPEPVELPAPLARWTFDEDYRDELGVLHGSPQGSPRLRDGRLWLDGSSFLVTPALPKTLTEKTLDVWVSLATLDHRDGGVMSLSQGDTRSALVDCLVFAEREDRVWQVSADRRRRPPKLSGSAEAATNELVHLALVYSADGTVALYRNGEPYGEAGQLREAAVFEARLAQVSFGRRAPPANGLFVGAIDQAQLFDQALDAKQVALLAEDRPVAPALASADLLAVPEEAALAKANDHVRLVYKDEMLAAKTPAAKRMLAERLLEAADSTTSDDAGRYALLIAARDQFAQAGDAASALDAVDRLAELFDFDTFELKREIVPVAARAASGEPSVQLAQNAIPLAEEAIRRDDFDAARQLLQVAYTSARNGKSFALARDLADRQKQVGELAGRFAELESVLVAETKNSGAKNLDAESSEVPESIDADQHLAIGLYRVCVSDDWVTGLSHLAEGGDEQLRALAEREGSVPSDPLEQIKLGDGWWDAASTVDPVYAAALRKRATHWYRLAAPRLDGGLEKLVAERRLLELETAQNDGWRVIFRGTSPALWNTSIDSEQAFAVPLADVTDTVKFVRLRRSDNGQSAIVPINHALLVDGGPISNGLLWRSGEEVGGVQYLGIASIALRATSAGQPYIGTADKAAYGGWGFGGLWQDPAGRSLSWAGQPLSGVELEISVKSEALLSDEQKSLLR